MYTTATAATPTVLAASVAGRVARRLWGLFLEPDPRLSLPGPRIIGCESARDDILVIDVSGSMGNTDYSPSRLVAAVEAAIVYLQELAHRTPSARLAVVAYSGKARIVVPLTPVRKHRTIAAALHGLATLDSTNIAAGLRQTRRLTEASRAQERQVVLLSDGHNTDHGSPEDEARRLRALATIECVGIGGAPDDVDEALLASIASVDPAGRPRYRWIGDKQQLVAHYRQLAGRLSRS